MAKVSELLNSLDSASKAYDDFLQELLTSSCDIPFSTEEVESIENIIITSINTKCNKAFTRTSGLKFLLEILPRISRETLLKYGALWITKATQTLESTQSNISDLTIACKVLAPLVVTGKEIPELHKQVSMQNVKQFVYLISSMKPERRCGATYYLIAVLLHHYPEVCERSQESIRKIIIPHLDSSQQNLVTAGANCYTLLTKATERSFKPPTKFGNYTNWVYNQLLLCNSLHDIMNKLFTDISEFDSSEKRELEASETLNLPEISEDNVLEYYSNLEQRFLNLCVYLSTMLRGCGEKNSVSPTDILQVLCRGLAITPFNLGKESSITRQILFFMLPKLHVSLLEVLSALIEGFKKELMPFSNTILKLIQQTLDWTEKVSQDQSTLSLCKPFKKVRLSVYKTLSVWLTNAGTLSGVESVTKYLLPHISREIKVIKNTVLLTVQKTNHLSKKSQKKLRDSQYENSPTLGNSTRDSRDIHLNADLCEQALVALENILFSGNCWLNVSFYEKVKDEVVETLSDLYLGAPETNVYKMNASCRLQLLKTLKALQMNSHPLTPPPTQFSIEIFNMALRDEDFRVNQEAKLGLAELEKIVHPSAPTLDFPYQPRDQDEDEDDESNEFTNTTGVSHSMNELLDSIRTNESSDESKKRKLEKVEVIPTKLPRKDSESEPVVAKIASFGTENNSNLMQQSNSEINNEEQLVSPDDIGSSNKKSDRIPENFEKTEMETEIIKESLNEDDEKIEDHVQSQDLDIELVDLFVDELQEGN